ncbi:MAG: hypothetical protein IT427_10285, partial [Pirellulales bacterium]|nr:hypothetical protein [Pirellulales bacterium]
MCFIFFVANSMILARATWAEQKAAAGESSLGNAIVDRFDTNGNGKIDPAEATAARDRFGKRTAGTGQGAGLGGNGHRNAKFHQMLLKRFDANANGTLDPNEIRAAKAALEKMRAQKGKGSGQGTVRRKGQGSGNVVAARLKKFVTVHGLKLPMRHFRGFGTVGPWTG